MSRSDRELVAPSHFAALAAFLLGLSILRGLRVPNLWAVTHLTFNYSQGFVRRGLIGQVLWLFGHGRLYRYRLLAAGSVLLYLAVAVLLWRVVRRALRASGAGAGMQGAVLVFAASPGVVVLTHFIGYPEYFGLLVLAPFLLVGAGSTRHFAIFYMASAMVVVMAFVHESLFAFMLGPVIWFALVCHVVRASASSPEQRTALIAHLAATMLLGLGAGVAVGAVGTRSPVAIGALSRSVARVADFPIRYDAFDALSRPVRDNLFSLMPGYWRHDVRGRTALVVGWVAILPVCLYLVMYGTRLIRLALAPGVARAVLIASLVGAALAPQLLNFVGWDSTRWNAISILAVFLCIVVFRLFLPAREADPATAALPSALTIAVVAVGLCCNYDLFLFDDYTVQGFPFYGHLRSFAEIVNSHFAYLPRR
jgi:hypothetical protein